jgi:hypothetical protein
MVWPDCSIHAHLVVGVLSPWFVILEIKEHARLEILLSGKGAGHSSKTPEMS